MIFCVPVSPEMAGSAQPMSPRQPGPLGEQRGSGRLVAAGFSLVRRAPTRGSIARRRFMINVTKYLLPLGALTLLATVALWPEIEHVREQGRSALRVLRSSVDGAELTDARYRGVDDKGRPYTVTADTARQAGPERVRLVSPRGDMTLENGSWLFLESKLGHFVQKTNQLDLWTDVVLYRDDGTTLKTASASIDLKAGAAAGSEQVHAEGPFGVIDAQGFALTDNGAAIDFVGPARLVTNNGPK